MNNHTPRYLTKTRMKIGLECPKKLYYYDQYKEQDDDNKFLEILAEGGYQVGELAKYYYKFHYPNYHFVDITSLDYEESLESTRDALQYENVVIAEPAIVFDNFFIRVDVLVKNGKNIQLIEVKAKSFNSVDEYGFLNLKKSPITVRNEWRPYIADVAFQTYVTSSSFPDWSITPYLMLVNKNKKTNMDGLNQLFPIIKTEEKNGKTSLSVAVNKQKIISCKENIKDTVLQAINVKSLVNSILYEKKLQNKEFNDVLNKPLMKFGTDNEATFIEASHLLSDAYRKSESLDSSKNSIGACCHQCMFCWQDLIPNYNEKEKYLPSIWNFPKNKLKGLFEEKVFSVKDLYNNLHLNPLNPSSKRYERQYLQIKKTAKNDSSEWFSDDISEKINNWVFPLHFIDFETCTVPLPFHENEYPYAIIAFQFSVHSLFEDGSRKHNEWLVDQNSKDPTIKFVRKLQEVLSRDTGQIFMYANHENAVLKSAKERMKPFSAKYKEEISFIDSITFTKDKHEPKRAMINLCKFVEENYYNPHTNGSNSIKAVLPAIMSSSKILKQRYSQPLTFGTNLINFILFQEKNGKVTDPYDMLPKIEDLISKDLNDNLFQNDSLKEGSSAMKAFQILQFSQISKLEKDGLRKGLLNYCELDTLAMLMLYEHLSTLSG